MNPSRREFNATATWYPQLDGLGLPRALISAMGQAYSLIYSLRDAIKQVSATISSTLTTRNVQIAYATVDLTLTTNPADIAGATLTLNQAGQYFIQGIFCFVISLGDVGPPAPNMVGILNADGSDQIQQAILAGGGVTGSATVPQQWIYTAPDANRVVKLRAFKSGGTGASIVALQNTSISALWVGP